MLREFLGKFSGSQLTVIAVAVILGSSAVGTAAVTFSPVTIVAPTTGKQSLVDTLRRLFVYDPIAGYRNNPANFVEISVSNFGNQCETPQQYTIPAGKALVLTAISGYEAPYNTNNYAGFNVYTGSGCAGSLIAQHWSSVGTANHTLRLSSIWAPASWSRPEIRCRLGRRTTLASPSCMAT